MPRIRVKILKLAARDDLVYRWRDRAGKEHQRTAGTANLRKAETGRARLEVELAGPEACPEISFAEFEIRYKEEWLASLRIGTRVTADSAFKQVKKHVGPLLLSDVATTSGLLALETKMRESGLAAASVKGYLGHFRASLSWAEDAGLITAAPRMKRKRRQRKVKNLKARGRSITTEEFERMLAAVDLVPECRYDKPAWKRLLKGLFYGGLRLAEAQELGWGDESGLMVDLSGKRPRLRIWSEAEKGDSDRFLPIVPDFANLLLETEKELRQGRVYSIIGRYGKPLAVKTIGDAIIDIGKKANVLVNRQTCKTASAHDLRRSFGTRWSARVMPAVLKELMRHSSIETTMKFYVTHQADDLSRELWDKWGEASAEAREGDKMGDKTQSSRKRSKRNRSANRKTTK